MGKTNHKTAHRSAAGNHYDKEARDYDAFNEATSRKFNRVLSDLLGRYGVRSVLDLSCGTGSQVFWLYRKGFEVTGYDINERMLTIARSKAKGTGLKFQKGDMRRTRAGSFDAVITIFNSIGHLTRADFRKALRNVHANLEPGGYYLFDIFNLEYLLAGDNITKFTIDWQKRIGNRITREIQFSTIDRAGVLTSYDTYYEQTGAAPPRLTRAFQTLQTYRKTELKAMLEKHGFTVVKQNDIRGRRFSETGSERILTVARKIG